jgi:hypothetical protein
MVRSRRPSYDLQATISAVTTAHAFVPARRHPRAAKRPLLLGSALEPSASIARQWPEAPEVLNPGCLPGLLPPAFAQERIDSETLNDIVFLSTLKALYEPTHIALLKKGILNWIG